MKTLYIDCGMGAAGDMLTAALLDLSPLKAAYVARLNALKIPGVTYELEKAVKCGITGSHMSVKVNGIEEDEHLHDHHHDDEHDHEHEHDHHHEHDHEHEHSHGGHSHTHTGMHAIEHIVWDLHLPEKVEKDVLAVYRIIAEAESQVHGQSMDQIHFHEVGTMDAVADVVAVSYLINNLKVDQIIASPVHVGSGTVKCAHGILPVPAPATALILKDMPIYSTDIRGELCTPTGAALLKHFVNRFDVMPTMSVSAIGYGMGKKDFPRANCVRLLLGETMEPAVAGQPEFHAPETAVQRTVIPSGKTPEDVVLELSCNVDDMTAEGISFAMEQLFAAGARDVYTQPIGMKKSRPGILLSVICLAQDADKLAEVMMKHTTTLGIRRQDMSRYVLDRKQETVTTEYGPVRVKHASGMGVDRVKPEYEDIAALAREHNLALEDIREAVRKNFR